MPGRGRGDGTKILGNTKIRGGGRKGMKGIRELVTREGDLLLEMPWNF